MAISDLNLSMESKVKYVGQMRSHKNQVGETHYGYRLAF